MLLLMNGMHMYSLFVLSRSLEGGGVESPGRLRLSKGDQLIVDRK